METETEIKERLAKEQPIPEGHLRVITVNSETGEATHKDLPVEGLIKTAEEAALQLMARLGQEADQLDQVEETRETIKE